MKQIFVISCLAVLASCNNAATDEAKTDSTATATGSTDKPTIPDMPYPLEKPYANWQIGNPQHALTAQTSLKAYETGDIAACVKGFGDSVRLSFDGYRAKLSNDSLGKWFAEGRKNYTNYKITMQDWESVISEDKKEEWVTLWYKQVMTDSKGKTDSLNVINDLKMENGKIVVLDEKIQHYPAKK